MKFAGFKKEIESASNAPEKLQQVHSKIQKTYHAVCKVNNCMKPWLSVNFGILLETKLLTATVTSKQSVRSELLALGDKKRHGLT